MLLDGLHCTSWEQSRSGRWRCWRVAVTLVIYYFAALRDLLGASEERIELAAPATVAELARALTQRHPQLEPHLGSVRFAVNETFVDASASLANGDVVALIPPVTGG